MDRATIVIVIVLLISILGSFPAASSSRKKQRIYGGWLGIIFHHLGVGAYIGVAPAALLGSILVGPLKFGIPLALSLLLIAFIFLFLYALAERSGRTHIDADANLWTQEDAKTSGL